MVLLAQKINDAGSGAKIYAQASTSAVLPLDKSPRPSIPPAIVTVELIAGGDLSKGRSLSFTFDHANLDVASIRQVIKAFSAQTDV